MKVEEIRIAAGSEPKRSYKTTLLVLGTYSTPKVPDTIKARPTIILRTA